MYKTGRNNVVVPTLRFAMRVGHHSFAMFMDVGFLIALAIILGFEAGFAALVLVLTKT